MNGDSAGKRPDSFPGAYRSRQARRTAAVRQRGSPSEEQTCSDQQAGEQDEGGSGWRIADHTVIQREAELRAIAVLIRELNARIRRDQGVDEIDARLRAMGVRE